MWLSIAFGAFVGFILFYVLHHVIFTHNNKKNNSLEALKNALLTYALVRTKKDDFAFMNMNYESYDGKQLPQLSGADISNACFSYIVDKEEFRKSPFYTSIMESKIDAINKYLDRTLDTNEKVEVFFTEYLQLLKTPIEKED